MVGEQGKFCRNYEMRLLGPACRRLVIRCRRHVGGVGVLLGHVANR